MPRPTRIPEKLLLEATIRPGPNAAMRTEENRTVPVKLLCTERKVSEFKIVAHGDDYLTVEGGGYRYRVDWSNADSSWNAGQAAPSRINVPHWATVGRSIRYVGTEALALTAIGPTTILRSTKLSGRFHVAETFARHIEVTIDGVVGRFRLNLDDDFTRNWAAAVDSHNEKIRHAKFLTPGRRIIPLDAEGKALGTTSYLILAVDLHGVPGGAMQIVPLVGDGVAGAPLTLPAWNSSDMWDLAPDDASKAQLRPGMTVMHGDEEFEVVSVDEINKRVTVERTQRTVFPLTDPLLQIVDNRPQEEPDRDRFTGILDEL